MSESKWGWREGKPPKGTHRVPLVVVPAAWVDVDQERYLRRPDRWAPVATPEEVVALEELVEFWKAGCGEAQDLYTKVYLERDAALARAEAAEALYSMAKEIGDKALADNVTLRAEVEWLREERDDAIAAIREYCAADADPLSDTHTSDPDALAAFNRRDMAERALYVLASRALTEAP